MSVSRPASDGDRHEDAVESRSRAELDEAAELQSLIARQGEHARRQGWIATCVVSLYIGVVGAATLAYVVAAWRGADGAAMLAPASQIRDLANTLVLPIVTLVLGYYFGKRAD